MRPDRRGYGLARPCPACGRAICRVPTTGRILRHNLPLVPPDGTFWVRWHGKLTPVGTSLEPGYPSIPKPHTRCLASGVTDEEWHAKRQPAG